MMKKHFVRFYSPGTFVSETSELPIESWDVKEAVKMSKNIKERYGSTPYGFIFLTRSRNDDELDSKISDESNFYFIGGNVLTLNDIKERNDPRDSILISNMQNNNWDKVIVNTNSWKTTLPFDKNDVVLHMEDFQNE